MAVSQTDTVESSSLTLLRAEGQRELKEKHPRVMVAGANGRVGQLVVEEVLKRVPGSTVVAVVRNTTAAEEAFGKVHVLPIRPKHVQPTAVGFSRAQLCLEGAGSVVQLAALSVPQTTRHERG
jgi:uncharacterized protein YbjT (DUF2867 family)